MTVGVMILELFCESSHSLKEKRHIISSIKEKLRHKFNISIIESDYQDLWQKIQLAVAVVADSKTFAGKVFNQVEDFIALNYAVQLIHVDKQYW
ncbi:MAG: DUF503 domain-containing protein [Candidatus Aminicenantes bacterium]|nr:DUF503 domain-containing protein [Candidatus Aminicenantes bacterium]